MARKRIQKSAQRTGRLPSKGMWQAGRLLQPLIGKNASKGKLREISAKTGLPLQEVQRIEKRLNQRWLVHKTKRELLKGILSNGLKPSFEHTSLLNEIFDKVKPKGVKIARTKANYFATRQVVESHLRLESLLLSSDMLGWLGRKDIESLDATRVRARVDVRKVMVFDETLVDNALKIIKRFGLGGDKVDLRDIPKPELKRIQAIAGAYWRTGMTFGKFERFYYMERDRILKKRGAPASLPAEIKRPEILYPGGIAASDLREVRDWYNKKVDELRKQFGVK